MDRNGREETKEKNVNFKARMHTRMIVEKPYSESQKKRTTAENSYLVRLDQTKICCG